VLFNIAQDLTKMQVYAKTDESDVGQIKVGQPITFTVDAFPRDTFRGTVEQIRMNPTTVQNVVTYDTVVNFDNPDTKLFPGMTAYVTIPVANADGVLKVPNGALRFTPDKKADQLRVLYEKNGINAPANRTQQQGNAQANVQQQSHAAPDRAIVWKLTPENQLERVQLKTGITVHTFTQVAQVAAGSLKPGDQLVIGSATAGQKSGSGPMMRGIGH